MTHDSRDFTPAVSNWLVRAYYTPVSDALRGQLSARLDVRPEIAAAGLPAPLAGLIYTVVRRTRLWRNEKLDVARELIAHFSDGLSAGRSVEELAKDFGSPEQAAKLIRKAKRRNRPLWWQCYRIGSWLLLVVLVCYAAFAARFYLGQPQIAHNYWHEINAARQVPEAQRAWPLYREAVIKLGKTNIEPEWLDAGPMGKHWNEAMAKLETHRESVELCHQAAKKPYLGYFWGDPADRAAAQAAQADWLMNYNSASVADDNESMISAILDGIQSMRSLARLLLADARRAAIAGDGATVVADLAATISMSERIYQPKCCLVEQLVSFAIFNLTLETAGRILGETPAVLTDEQLRELAHRIAAYREGTVPVDFGTEQMAFDDLLQRVYTDDGQGNGRITPAGVAWLADFYGQEMTLFRASKDNEAGTFAAHLVSPGLSALVGSRQENRELFQSLIDESVRLHQGPPWLWDQRAITAHRERLQEAGRQPTQRLRYAWVLLMFPALDAIFDAAERTAQIRDAAEVAIALVLWHRRHGDWPTSLGQLTPDLLPTVPPDRVDGQPLRYVVRDGQSALYSIGRNRRDDGGQPSSNPNDAAPIRFGPPAHRWDASSEPDGDWILWPPLQEKEEASD
jgi:hypothetical protein